MLETEKLAFRRKTRKATLLVILGVCLLALTAKYDFPDPKQVQLWLKTMREGLIIAAWVAIWEALTEIVFSFGPYATKALIYKKMLACEIKIMNPIKALKI